MSNLKTEATPRLKAVALPAEHGAWAFFSEPMLAGMLLAPTLAGLWLSIAAFGVFLIHQPLKIAIKDRLKCKYYLRTQWAERFVALYALLAVVGVIAAYVNAGNVFLPPILLAVPFACVQLIYDARNRGRDTIPEICGAVSLGALAPTLTLISGWTLGQSLWLWVILAVRAVTSILYVRARLRLEKGKMADTRLAVGAHLLAMLGVVGLAFLGLVPKLSLIVFAILLARAAYGLSSHRRPTLARNIGFQEIGYGLMTVLLTVLGYRL